MSNAVLITVRLKSTRLKKKVMLEYKGKPVLEYMTNRLKHNFDGRVVICTSTHPEDIPLVDFARKAGIECFAGSEEDVLERYFETCKAFGLDKIYIVYGDEPFTDIDTMRWNFDTLTLDEPMWIKNDALPEGTYGYGLNFKGIEYLHRNKLSENLEVWQIMASEMPIRKIESHTGMRNVYENIRLTIDYPEDFDVFKRIIDYIGKDYTGVKLAELVKLYNTLDLYKINGFRIEEYKARIKAQGTINQ
ncbi:MAG: hypothetical protein JXA23_01845 [Bacteroidales bacterium]|nr:hypothetical protein [Bacteroidales bacterium]